MNRNTIEKILIGVIILLSMFIVYKTYTLIYGADKMANVSSLRLSYGRLLTYIEMGWVTQIDLYNNCRTAIVQASSPELGNRPQLLRVEIPIGAFQFIQKLKEYGVDFDAHPIPEKSIFVVIASNLVLPLIFLAILVFFFQNPYNFPTNGGMSPMNLAKSPARLEQNVETGVSFTDIAGVDEAKEEFEEIVSFLKEPERYTVVGAKIPKGVLLIGPPGTGKTLLAKAIANEATVPFYRVAGSEFVEMFIGIGAARIRDLFKRATNNSPCIIFIDEIDAVGRERGAGIGGGNDEREQTLNQLLTEMDGFRENKGVIVIGATNRSDILDSALLRPGRFDRQITIGLPDLTGRIGILNVHAKNKRLSSTISLSYLASRTIGFSGADLANVLNEAAILAAREKRISITINDISEAADRIVGGIEGETLEDTKSRRIVAYHEVGHALVGTMLPAHDKVDKVTLAPRGSAKGLTWFIADEDQPLLSRAQLLARISTTLAGRLAENLILGEEEITTGASNDLRKVTETARLMVERYGMSGLGPISLEMPRSQRRLLFDYRQNKGSDKVDSASSSIIRECETKASKLIELNKFAIPVLAERLLDEETIDGVKFRNALSDFTVAPINGSKPRLSTFVQESQESVLQRARKIKRKIKSENIIVPINLEKDTFTTPVDLPMQEVESWKGTLPSEEYGFIAPEKNSAIKLRRRNIRKSLSFKSRLNVS